VKGRVRPLVSVWKKKEATQPTIEKTTFHSSFVPSKAKPSYIPSLHRFSVDEAAPMHSLPTSISSNYPLISAFVAFALAQSIKFFATWFVFPFLFFLLCFLNT